MMSHSSLTGDLLVIARNPPADSRDLFPRDADLINASIVLIHDAVGATGIGASSVHVLEEDLLSRGLESPYPRVAYSALVRMMFDAKRVIVL